MITNLKSFFILALLTSLFVSTNAFAETKIVAQGTWVKKTQKISGSWQIVDNGKSRELQLLGFKTKKAPDLQVFLSPQTVEAASNKNAVEKSFSLGKLKSVKGNQTYAIPPEVELEKYSSLLIHCKKYSKLWGAANLKKK